MRIHLPWPPSELSPNKRNHWHKSAKAKAAYRERCRVETMLQQPGKLPDGPLALHLEFVPPDRRRRDRDNLLASMKAGLDGLADALRIDDARFDSITIRVDASGVLSKARSRVRLTIAPALRVPFMERDASGSPTGVAL